MTIQEVVKLAENGDIGAMLTLGQHFMDGESRDTDEAKKWYVMAAEHQVPHAAHMAAIISTINAMGADLLVNQKDFEPIMVEFICEEWKDAYKWLAKTIEYKKSGAPNLEEVDLEDLNNKKEEAAYKCGIYCFYMDKHDEAINWGERAKGSWADLVKGIALFQKATTNEEYERAMPCLNKVVNDRAFLEINKNQIEEEVMSLAAKYVAHMYQKGLVLSNEANYDKALEVLNAVYSSLKYSSGKERLASQIAEIQRMQASSANTATSNNTNSSSGGCYVATAVYGSYDCPEVWTLRRYRDDVLASTWYGRAFVRTYYAVSPTLVKWFGHTEWFKDMWRDKLDYMVKSLKGKGFEDTPYDDRQW